MIIDRPSQYLLGDALRPQPRDLVLRVLVTLDASFDHSLGPLSDIISEVLDVHFVIDELLDDLVLDH